MKYEWRKQEKILYQPKKTPQIVEVPQQKFISLAGIGDPNGPEFKQRIETLYPLAYGLKAAYRKYAADKDIEFDDYVVFPLEGVWSLTEEGQKLDHLDKNEFSYDIMIQIPSFVPDDLIEPTIANVKAKKNPEFIDEIEIKNFEPIEAVEILHVGDYDDEPASFAKMDDFVNQNGKERAEKIHREIYLSDARRVDRDKLKTILRYKIK
ncbi:GyrI-like domain-containing protein [Companilactobacillus mishanensis]|uniref:GyrI-like domain-containing protein n=1 Tax=Companilactobacillus mishanensis TaxID=2486008 RepID=UPI001294EF7F|nr:GyrI-like domain-containing protein [Companilactobacillus mishanensis]MQS89559.1 hypothetical protein [Companilactobacillus mishanensis]